MSLFRKVETTDTGRQIMEKIRINRMIAHPERGCLISAGVSLVVAGAIEIANFLTGGNLNLIWPALAGIGTFIVSEYKATR